MDPTVPEGPWNLIDGLRKRARLLLDLVAMESGKGSNLCMQCAAVWLRAEGEAAVALLYADLENAIARLDQALRELSGAPEVARRA